MKVLRRTAQRKVLGAVCSAGILFQFGSCDLGEITTTTTTTLDGRTVILNLLRSAIITPIDAFLAEAVDDLFTNE
jgi:hypothetical protein